MSLPQSDDETLLLHNPRCSKSRATLVLLQERGAPFSERCYLDEPLSVGELKDLQTRLGRAPSEWVRGGEAAFEEAGLSKDSSDDDLIAAMAREPILMERPIVVRGGRAVVGRPPEAVLEIL
ncbi:MAG: arsenate reductase (glutaredoxin) [Deltaproteobacteria bacterium]|nr:arsenate reductase (glutaredoxin) [Deltaproteobacteria bacterium]MBW2417081.1 arsenate reductase (glutaredoxin) [Deltaproteobacteria bacterium]